MKFHWEFFLRLSHFYETLYGRGNHLMYNVCTTFYLTLGEETTTKITEINTKVEIHLTIVYPRVWLRVKTAHRLVANSDSVIFHLIGARLLKHKACRGRLGCKMVSNLACGKSDI